MVFPRYSIDTLLTIETERSLMNHLITFSSKPSFDEKVVICTEIARKKPRTNTFRRRTCCKIPRQSLNALHESAFFSLNQRVSGNGCAPMGERRGRNVGRGKGRGEGRNQAEPTFASSFLPLIPLRRELSDLYHGWRVRCGRAL